MVAVKKLSIYEAKCDILILIKLLMALMGSSLMGQCTLDSLLNGWSQGRIPRLGTKV